MNSNPPTTHELLSPVAFPTPQNKPNNEKKGSKEQAQGKDNGSKQLLLGLVFGVIFGFLLQKGGVAKYDVLLGALFLTDFTVMKIMLTAIAVSMIRIFSMHALAACRSCCYSRHQFAGFSAKVQSCFHKSAYRFSETSNADGNYPKVDPSVKTILSRV